MAEQSSSEPFLAKGPARSIAALGFRRWYGRQLYASYAWLATCLLGGVAFAAILEFVGFGGAGLAPYAALVVLYFVGLMVVHAFRRFWSMLSHAQGLADRAICTRCEAYGRFEVLGDREPVPVRCRDCGHEWSVG